MKSKKLVKKIVAVLLVVCLCIPIFEYADFSGLFKSDLVYGVTMDGSDITVNRTYYENNNYPTTTYMANMDYNGDGDYNDTIVEFDDLNGNGVADAWLPEIVDNDGDGRIFLGYGYYEFADNNFVDQNGDGKIDTQDIVDPYTIEIELFDANGDGVIDWRDSASADLNGDGVINWNDTYYQDLNGDGIINEYFDYDGDGYINPISDWKDQFVLSNTTGLDSNVKIVDYIDLDGDGIVSEFFDLNGDGVVTADEWVDLNGNGKPDGQIVSELRDFNSNGILGETITEGFASIAANPGSEYYTLYRKAEYFRTGNVNAYGTNPTISFHSADVMKRYNNDGSRVTNFKSNRNAVLGSDDNPIVLVEIVPDEYVSQLSLLFAGQEIFDTTYASLLRSSDVFSTYAADATGTEGLSSINQQAIGEAANGVVDGVYYNKNTFLKEVYGFGYENYTLTNAPLVDQYRFEGWYLGDETGKGLYNDNIYSEENKFSNFNNFTSLKNSDVHLYAKWSYRFFAGSYGLKTGYDGWLAAPYTALIDNSIDVKVDGADTNRNNVIDAGESSVVNLANKVDVDSVTFHLVKPSGAAEVKYYNALGEFTEIVDVTAKAPISFFNDYDFYSGVIGGGINASTSINGWQTDKWGNNRAAIYMFPYPSLMGNSDYAIKSSNKGNVQVITVTAQELTDAFTNGKTQEYIDLLTNCDLVYLENRQYTGLYTPVSDFVNSRSGNSATQENKLSISKNLLRTSLHKNFENDSLVLNAISNSFSTSALISDLDIEGFVAETLFKNMAGINSYNKEIPLVFDMTAAKTGGSAEDNITKLYWLSVMNNDATQVYNDWYGGGNPIVLKDRTTPYPCSKQTLCITPFVSGQGEKTAWYSFTVIPSTSVYNDLNNIRNADIDDYNSLIAKGYFDNDNRGNSGSEQLTYNFMSYRGDKAIMQEFLHNNYNSNSYTTEGFEYMKNENLVSETGTNATTAISFRFLLNATAGTTDEIIIINETRVTAHNGINVSCVVDALGTGTANIMYYIKTNDGTDYYVEYYKVNAFLEDYDAAIAGAETKYTMVTSYSTPPVGNEIITYKINNSNEYITDILGNNVPCDVVSSITLGGNSLTNVLGYTAPLRLSFGVSTNELTADASESYDMYLIRAYHNDGRLILNKYVEVRKTSIPFVLD